MNEQISKEEKIKILASLVIGEVGFYAEFGDDQDSELYDEENFKTSEKNYQVYKAMLADYSPEEAASFSDDFLTEVNQYVDDINEKVRRGGL